MAEPTSSAASVGIAAAFAALLGPTFGPYAVIVWAAFAGAMWPLSKRPTATRLAGVLFVLRVVATATIVTVPAAVAMEQQLGVPVHHAIGLVALGIGMVGDDWPRLARAGGLQLWRRAWAALDAWRAPRREGDQ
jgi:hypothetical protein